MPRRRGWQLSQPPPCPASAACCRLPRLRATSLHRRLPRSTPAPRWPAPALTRRSCRSSGVDDAAPAEPPLTRVAAAAASVSALAIVACGDSSTVETGAVAGNPSDRAFVAEMIPHHESAVEMAEIARARGEHDEIRGLADAIVAERCRRPAGYPTCPTHTRPANPLRRTTRRFRGGGLRSAAPRSARGVSFPTLRRRRSPALRPPSVPAARPGTTNHGLAAPPLSAAASGRNHHGWHRSLRRPGADHAYDGSAVDSPLEVVPPLRPAGWTHSAMSFRVSETIRLIAKSVLSPSNA